MKRTLVILAMLTLAALPAEARWHFPAEPAHPNQGIPVLDPADLSAAHAILAPAVASGAGLKVKALDNCAVAWLAHPEYLSSPVTAPVAAVTTIAPVGPVSEAAAALVKLDANARSLQKKAALFSAPLPDDIALACSPLVAAATPIGIAHALLSALHPVAAAVRP